jgi:hypothetical protein
MKEPNEIINEIIIDNLPDEEASQAGKYLRFLMAKNQDPMLKAFFEVQKEDEPVADLSINAFEESEEAAGNGEITSI